LGRHQVPGVTSRGPGVLSGLNRTDCPPRTFDAHVGGIQADIQDDLAMSGTILKARRRLCMADGPAELKPS
jgi:hypothetical protein